MEEALEKSSKKSRKALLKALIFIAFIIVAIFLVRFTGLTNLLTAKALGDLIDSAGVWAPLIFIFILNYMNADKFKFFNKIPIL